ncbi:replicative DNA helicase [Leadbetterella sp. DM7]|uniref:replicative DNA helicase n=1 Tax=Leadbetterella sp. DM7 TaxID=3235085 RepID=UPI00349E7613
MDDTALHITPGIQRQQVGRLPHTTEIESAVLGALLIDKESVNLIREILSPDSFYLEEHKVIYKVILDMADAGEAIDTLSVTRELRSKGLIRQVGGPRFVAALTSHINSASNVEFHAMIMAQAGIKREMIRVASEIMEEGIENELDIFELLDKTEQSFFKISERNIRKNYADAKSIMKTTIAELENKKLNNNEGITGVPSGFKELDALTGGWQKTELIIIAARPGMGKTAFVVSAMRNAAVDHQKPVAIFSLEMSSTQLMLRMISAEAELDSEKLRKGTLQQHEWEQLHHRITRLASSNIFIDDTPALSILELRAKCRRLKAQHDIQMVIIDYLQLMTGDAGSGVSNSREQEIATISRSLKNLAKELEVPVIALSQLSRAVETRGGNKRPQLSDLRESGSIEQDADMVMFLYRPEYYKIMEDENGNSTEGVGEVIIAKNRAGITETVQLRFVGKYTKFANLGEYNNTLGSSAFSQVSGLDHFESQGPSDPGLSTFKSKINPPEGGQKEPDGGDYPF